MNGGYCECGCRLEKDNIFCPYCGKILHPVEFPIPIIGELIQLCRDWHGGQASAMYSVSSTGTIHNADILRSLGSELGQVIRDCEKRLESIPPGADRSDTDNEAESFIRIASRWQDICHRWEKTLPDSDENLW